MDLFRENVTLVHCSVVVCDYVLPFDKRDKAYKAQAHCLTYVLTGLHEMFHP